MICLRNIAHYIIPLSHCQGLFVREHAGKFWDPDGGVEKIPFKWGVVVHPWGATGRLAPATVCLRCGIALSL